MEKPKLTEPKETCVCGKSHKGNCTLSTLLAWAPLIGVILAALALLLA